MYDFKNATVIIVTCVWHVQCGYSVTKMCCRILLFYTLVSNPQPFHFQGIARDHLGTQQQIRNFLKKTVNKLLSPN